jgi:hypothetical protein
VGAEPRKSVCLPSPGHVYDDPRALLEAGPDRIAELLAAGRGFPAATAQTRARGWVGVAQAAVALYGDDPAMPYADLAAELATQIRLLRGVLAEQRPHERARERAYRKVEPDQLARSLPGIAEVGAPLLVAAMGRPSASGRRPGSRRSPG